MLVHNVVGTHECPRDSPNPTLLVATNILVSRARGRQTLESKHRVGDGGSN